MRDAESRDARRVRTATPVARDRRCSDFDDRHAGADPAHRGARGIARSRTRFGACRRDSSGADAGAEARPRKTFSRFFLGGRDGHERRRGALLDRVPR